MAIESTLFRQEAIESAGRRAVGSVVLPMPVSLMSGFLISLVTGVGLVAVFSFGQYSPRQTVAGALHPISGIAKVYPQRSGLVTSIDVVEGDVVTHGQRLGEISSEQTLATGESAQREFLEQLARERDRLAAAAELEWASAQNQMEENAVRIEGLTSQLVMLEQETAALQSQLAHGQSILDRVTQLHQHGYVTDLELAQRKEHQLSLQRELHKLQRARVETSGAEAASRSAAKQLRLESARRQKAIEGDIAVVEREETSAKHAQAYTVVAPVAGKVTALQMQVGRAAIPATPLMAIVPEGAPLEAHLLVPSRAIGFVRKGQEVRLRYSAYPYQQYGTFGAEITDVSSAPLVAEEWGYPSISSEPLYRVKARLAHQRIIAKGDEISLQAGMMLEADIILEERPLWAWFLQPFMALRGRL